MNVFSGKWEANLEKSQRHANHMFHSATLVFEIERIVGNSSRSLRSRRKVCRFIFMHFA